MAWISEDKWPKTQVSEVMSKKLLVGYAEETLSEALDRMTGNSISHLPVVELGRPDKLIGLLAVRDIVFAYDLQRKVTSTVKE
jgi:CBS domain-containing protein